jgi:hypothetical protein
VAIHPYSFPADPSDASKDWNLFARLPAIRAQVADAAGRPLPIWFTEFGAPHDAERPERQGEIIAEALNCSAHWIWSGPIFVYALNDAAADPGALEFGLVDPSGIRRPAWSAVQAFAAAPWSPTPSACSTIQE